MNTLTELISCMSDYDPEALPVERAREVIRAATTPISDTELLDLRAALGRILAEDIIAPIDVPAHDNSAMDGYAVRSADLPREQPKTFTEIGASFAGRPFHGEVGADQCVRIMTGAVMPQGADTVVMQEHVHSDGHFITIPAGQVAGQNRRRAGEDLQKGTPALHRGKFIRPADLGLLASLGIAQVKVVRRLKVAFFSTGDELRGLGEPLGIGEVYDSNRYTLYGMLTRMGFEIIDLGVVRDDPVAIESAFRTAAQQADAVITSGGVSVGEADYTKAIMERLGQVVFWKIAMRPGRPMAFGQIQSQSKNAYLFGLPGNPVSVMVTFYQFVRGALLHLQGCDCSAPPLLRARTQTRLRKKAGRTEFQRGILEKRDGEWSVRPTGAQGSGVLRSMSEANCFVILPHDLSGVETGEWVDVMLMEGLI